MLKLVMNIYKPKPEEIPSGICECGCGQGTPIAKVTYRKKGEFRGYPIRFCPWHKPTRQGTMHNSWKGGRYYHRGWIYIHAPNHPNHNQDGYIFEHRLVMEKVLGRLLLPQERVHHINGIQDDNRPENLIVLTQSTHMKVHHNLPLIPNIETCKQAGRLGAQKRWAK